VRPVKLPFAKVRVRLVDFPWRSVCAPGKWQTVIRSRRDCSDASFSKRSSQAACSVLVLAVRVASVRPELCVLGSTQMPIGIGCEVLKNLVMTGFGSVEIVRVHCSSRASYPSTMRRSI
jgi:hypothetical protein